MDFEWMNGPKKQNDLALGYYHYFFPLSLSLSLSLCCCCSSSFITIKSDIACIYYSARYTETRQAWSLVRVLLCSWLTFKPGCYGFQNRCIMHMLPTWCSTLSQVGNGFVSTSRGRGIERDGCKSKVVFWQGIFMKHVMDSLCHVLPVDYKDEGVLWTEYQMFSTGRLFYCNWIRLRQTELFKRIVICCYIATSAICMQRRVWSNLMEYSTDCLWSLYIYVVYFNMLVAMSKRKLSKSIPVTGRGDL
jgi:hypothetical protein